MNRKHPSGEIPEADKLLPNSAVDDFFVKMNRQVRRPRPSEEAVAAALQAIQRLAGEVATGEGALTTDAPALIEAEPCPKCGGINAESNRFCGFCGALVDRTANPAARPANPTIPPPVPATSGQHIYHYHYHHHYFPGNSSQTAEALSLVTPEPSSAGVSSLDTAVAEVGLRQLVQDWTSQANAKSIEGLAALYCGDAIWVRSDATLLRSPASLRQFLESWLAGASDIKLEATDIRVLGALAWLAGVSRNVATSARSQQERTGKFFMLARYENRGWRILADIWCMNRDPLLPAGNESLAQEPAPVRAPSPAPRNRHRYTW